MEVPLQVNLTIVGARDLPKTDFFSDIDPYVTVTVAGGSHGKTEVMDNNANPTWDHELILLLNYNPTSHSLPSILFELWDKNSKSKDEKVGTSELQVTQLHLQGAGKVIDLPFTMIHKKHSKHNSVLVVRFGEYAYSCKGLYNIVKNFIPNALFQDHGLGRLYIPLSVPHVVLAVEYEKKSADVKLYLTSPTDTTYVDMVQVHHQNSKIRRRKVTHPTNIFQTVSFFEEIKMNDIPFSTLADPGKILFFVFQKELISKVGLDEVVTEHGWEGSMDFKAAAKRLRDVQLNRKEEEIFIHKDDSFIVVDFDKDNVDMKCLVLDVPSNSDVSYDFQYHGDDVKKTTEVYSPSRPVLGGKYKVQRKLELDDVPFGTPFSKMEWFKYRVSSAVQISFFDVLKVHPF